MCLAQCRPQLTADPMDEWVAGRAGEGEGMGGGMSGYIDGQASMWMLIVSPSLLYGPFPYF